MQTRAFAVDFIDGIIFNRIVKYEDAVINDRLSDCFAALADPTRRAIVARLSQGELTVNELAEPFAISLPAISRHLKVLEQAGLISRSKTAQQRPAKFEPQAIKAIADWVDRSPRRSRRRRH